MKRELSKLESKNRDYLLQIFPEASTILLTKTGLEKSIMDATHPLRANLKLSKLHDYDLQMPGPDHKVLIEALIWDGSDFEESRASLYRPMTKDGDPRIWISKIQPFVKEDVVLSIVPFEKKLYVFNLTTFDIEWAKKNEFFENAENSNGSIAIELLEKMRFLSKSWITGLRAGDCSVGDTLEASLGLKQNSSKNPDYKGIEIKSKRNASKTRANLFAQVPNWKISPYISSEGILDAFGYIDKESGFKKLYVTVSAKQPNNQGLQLCVNYKNRCVEEVFVKPGKSDVVARWEFDKLLERLLSKHKETFWIMAESCKIKNQEYLLYTSIEHTKKPIVENLFLLIESGEITLDHLIKRDEDGVVEKGPIFKMSKSGFEKLFPSPKSYTLVEKEMIKIQIAEISKRLA